MILNSCFLANKNIIKSNIQSMKKISSIFR